MEKKSYTVSVTLETLYADNPLEAAKKLVADVVEDGFLLIYDVEDEETGEKFTVDLSEEDENAVLPFKD